jgi:hypothetical protein
VKHCASLQFPIPEPVSSAATYHIVWELEPDLLYSVPGPLRRAFVRRLRGPNSQGSRSLGYKCSGVELSQCSSRGCEHITVLCQHLKVPEQFDEGDDSDDGGEEQANQPPPSCKEYPDPLVYYGQFPDLKAPLGLPISARSSETPVPFRSYSDDTAPQFLTRPSHVSRVACSLFFVSCLILHKY